MRTFEGLLLSCRAVHAETELVLYSENVFQHTNRTHWMRWLRLLEEEKRAAVRTVRVSYFSHYLLPRDEMAALLSFPNIKTILVSGRLGRKYQKIVKDHAQARKLEAVLESAEADAVT